MMEEDQERMMSLRSSRRKKPSVGIICCFTGTTHHHRHASFDAYSPTPRGWFKSKSSSAEVVEMKGKCRNFISRIGRHRRHASAEFSYDPLSYSLNFDHDAEDDLRAMSFSARFPTTPRAFETPPSAGHLSRGFDKLAETMKASTRNKSVLSKTAAEEEEEEKKVATPVPISSSNREILVQMC